MTEHTSDTLIQNKKEVPSEFNRIAKRYDIATSLSQGYQKDLETSVERLNLKGNEYLADLCCGTGKSTIACLNNLPEGKVIGIDNSEGMLQAAREKLIQKFSEDKVTFVQQDVMNLDLSEDSLDAIFMAYGIRNMPDFEKCVRNLHSVLKPGGKICFHEYSISKSFVSKLYWKFLGNFLIVPFAGLTTGSTKIFRYLIKSVETFLSPNEFTELLKKAGFENVKHTPLESWRKPILHTFTAQKPQ
ncbi:MAG: class I SAM-dependent methyltransferase [Ignavibacteriaceae bacterium]|nr:class I SAM-dependent methyltransferase [Ignavibacteria bacterium]MBT8392255.1 class I SAM-dependent methyltransferase [Ignavibacteria bacterium]NNJ52498.1 class I SAM-dependent methyltransferase [Ignavibacteriaceae bacterium]